MGIAREHITPDLQCNFGNGVYRKRATDMDAEIRLLGLSCIQSGHGYLQVVASCKTAGLNTQSTTEQADPPWSVSSLSFPTLSGKRSFVTSSVW